MFGHVRAGMPCLIATYPTKRKPELGCLLSHAQGMLITPGSNQCDGATTVRASPRITIVGNLGIEAQQHWSPANLAVSGVGCYHRVPAASLAWYKTQHITEGRV